MAFRPLLRQRPISPLTIGTLTASLLLYPYSTLHAEAPPQEIHPRKPIYDDLSLLSPPQPSPPPTQASLPPSSPTPTDRLAHHIKHFRLSLHAHSLAAENRLNAFMSAILHRERSFTQTIASLAPAPSTHEHIMPGALYVLVAAMAGAIVSRNRNVLLRATVPGAVGLGAAWVVLPVTMRNVGDLVWGVEERVPVVAINHLRVRGAVEEGWRQAKIREEATRRWFDERVGDGREAVEGWVRKGR